jgi:mRNA-degrading endonuclease RelE of RelBE toxin-antitoxin system
MKRFQIRFTPEASRLASRLSPETKKLIKDALKTLQKNPFLGDDLHEIPPTLSPALPLALFPCLFIL